MFRRPEKERQESGGYLELKQLARGLGGPGAQVPCFVTCSDWEWAVIQSPSANGSAGSWGTVGKQAPGLVVVFHLAHCGLTFGRLLSSGHRFSRKQNGRTVVKRFHDRPDGWMHVKGSRSEGMQGKKRTVICPSVRLRIPTCCD